MAKQPAPILRTILPVFATLFVVAGVAAVMLSRPKDDVSPAASPEAQTAPSIEDGTVTVFSHEGKINVIRGNETKTCDLPPEAGRIVHVSSDGILNALANGDTQRIGFDCTAAEGRFPKGGWINPSGTRGTRPGESRQDGTGSVVISDGENDNTVILRGTNARPYRDPTVVGWMDDEHLAVVAFQGDTRHALRVEPTGGVTSLAPLPETATEFSAGDGTFWYVTVTPGPGIEFGPRGPSEIHRVADGTDEIMARNPEDAIESLAPGPGNRYAYVAGGTAYFGMGEERNIGTGRPLGWDDAGSLLQARNGKLMIIGDDEEAAETDIGIPDGVTSVWRVTLDDPSTDG